MSHYKIVSENLKVSPPTRDFILYVSVDPGIKNLAIRCEKRYNNGTIEVPIFKIISVDENFYMKSITESLDELNIDIPDFVIIEKQQTMQKKVIYFIYQHILSYFTFRYENNHTKIISISPKAKSKVFPSIVGTYNQRKKESIEIAKSITDIPDCKKQDDYADTVCQLEAFIKLYKIK
jgi:hypothetical protein